MINFYEDDLGFVLATIHKKYTGLPVNLFLDELSTLRKYPDNTPTLYIQGDYKNKRTDNLIPVTISKDPKFIKEPTYIVLEDREFILNWVKKYYDPLMEHWRGEIASYDVIDKIGYYIPKKNINESQTLLEMSNLSKKDTKLPMNIWLDDTGNERNNTHNNFRLKFQANKSNNIQDDNLITISISEDNPQILIDNPKYNFKESEIKELKEWIKKYYYIIMAYYKGFITLSELKEKILQKHEED